MKAWLLDQLQGVERMRLAEAPDPVPADDEVLLRVHYAALNPADRYLAERLYPADPPLPHVLGRDAVGTVEMAGPAVPDARPGQRYAVLRGEAGVSRWGTFAQLVALPAANLAPIPAGWNDQEAAGASLVYLTAHQALTMWGALPPSVVLITGASGGVGVASVQLARALGHQVIALSRSEAKRRRLLELGATAALDPHDAGWRKRAKELAGPGRVGLAIDNVGGPLLPQVIETLGQEAKVSVVGRLAGPVPEFNTAALLFRRIRLGGVALSIYTAAQARSAWDEAVALLARTGARPVVDKVFEFDQLPAAFDRLREGPMGKVLVRVGQ
jgi:NADPH:quinone reductase